jgi:beta-phosphoglucomutase-like phosphatase (HAD superfamily)
MTNNKRLLLWDIDSTLITTGGAGDKALKRVVKERFGMDDNFHDIEIAGRTDAHIATSILRKYEIEPTRANVADFLEGYLANLQELLPQTDGRVLPGVAGILERLAPREDRVLALLTGNLRRGAQLKLERYGLWIISNSAPLPMITPTAMSSALSPAPAPAKSTRTISPPRRSTSSEIPATISPAGRYSAHGPSPSPPAPGLASN